MATREMPKNLEAEMSVLGVVFLNPYALEKIMENITEDMFFSDANKKIFRAFMELYKTNTPIDITTVKNELDKQKNLNAIGGIDYLSEIIDSVATSANLDYYMEIVKDKATRRRLIDTATNIITDAYDEEELEGGDVRTVMHLHPALAPYKAAVLPLSKKLSEKADEVYSLLAKNFNIEYDETGSIGKRYRRQDEIGTPFCITVDFETENDGCVTIRHRDSMTQERVKIEELNDFIAKSLEF